MKVRLATACYNVTALASAHEALHALRTNDHEIVLIGASLPDSTPIELCRMIRSLTGCRRLPVLMQVDESQRFAALSAGATAIVDPAGDELTLLARIRGLLRSTTQEPTELTEQFAVTGMEEPSTGFRHERKPWFMFVTDQTPVALGWRQALQAELGLRIGVCDPESALAGAESGEVPDLYLIAADIRQSGDGLRLLSELRSRNKSRHSAFVIVLRPERSEMTAVALDLGAGEVLPGCMTTPPLAAEAAIILKGQLERKLLADRQRRETQRNLLWAMTDPLTGLHNRRFALPHLAEMVSRSIAQRRKIAVLVMDIDHFKSVNDRFGHAAGDATLTGLGNRLREILPGNGLIARIGGEEFLAAFPVIRAEEAFTLAENLRRSVADTPFVLPELAGGRALGITISLGLAISQDPLPDLASDAAEILIARADRALLTAKSEGRNRIVIASRGLAA